MKRLVICLGLVIPMLTVFGQGKFVLDTIYSPAKLESKNVAVIYLGGSDGGIPDWDFERDSLPKLGYPTLGLGYFKTEHTPDTLQLIPLEYFVQAINDFTTRPEIKGKKIVIEGMSRGSDLALLLASMFPEKIDGVITMATSPVTWNGHGFHPELKRWVSCWTYRGKEIPFMELIWPFDISGDWIDYRKWYTESYAKQPFDMREKATIKVENINGPIMLFSGEEDRMMPAKEWGDEIMDRLKRNNFKFSYQHFYYPDVNHSFSYTDTEKQGGTAEANYMAWQDFKRKYIEFLDQLNAL
jgi:pimeloyl-ACP methyl ester carboxylesterase